MKKLLLILMVLGVAAPLFAKGRIQFSVVDNQNGSCTITYDCNDTPDTYNVPVVAMGLTVKVTSGNPIKSVVLEDPNDFMEIYMDAAWTLEDPCDPCDPCNLEGYNYGDGTPYADPCVRGEVSLTTHGNHFTLSFGGLGGEFEKTKPAPMHGTITLYADTQENPGAAGDSIAGTIKLNLKRGGIIGADGVAMETNLDDPAKAGPMAFTISECYRRDWTDYNVWKSAPVAKPYCWCYKYNCKGDTDGIGTGFGNGKKWVVLKDLNLLAASLTKRQDYVDMPANYQCANFDRKGTGFGNGKKWVVLPDLNILASGLAKRQDNPHFSAAEPYPYLCQGW